MDIHIAPTTAPNGRAALLLHGITAGPGEMKHLGSKLAASGWEVFIPVLSGHCTSVEEFRTIPAHIWMLDASRALEKVTNPKIDIIGQSFGGLLALYLAGASPERPTSVTALSPPLRFRSKLKERILSHLSYYPDLILNRLGLQKKVNRIDGTFVLPRQCYDMHSIAAAARIVQVRRKVFSLRERIKAPLLFLFDPADHHLSSRCDELAREIFLNPQVETIPGGEHELLLCKEHELVEQKIIEFLHGS